MNVWQRKIDDQRSVFQRVLPPKNALQTKRPVFYSPGEFTGRGAETHLHKRKVEILRFRAKRELSSNLPPKRKNRPEDRSVENFENGGPFFYFPEKFSPPQTGEFFESQKEEHSEAFHNFSLSLKTANSSSFKRVPISSSRKILHEFL